ncbi:MAG TPA: hypothetical protein VJ851_11980 [Jatrophihabitans sp.]|nr:hypothetical protein [Jatrophihabitans sp.]
MASGDVLQVSGSRSAARSTEPAWPGDEPAPTIKPFEKPPHSEKLEFHLDALRPTIQRSLRMFAEAMVIPTALFAIILHTVGLLPALGASLGWCYLVVAFRRYRGHRLSGVMLLGLGMMSGRALITLMTSSALIYLLQPVIGSACMATVFLGSALAGNPITIRLARDFVTIPAHVLARRGVRRMFTEIALIFGISRLADAGMTIGFLRLGVNEGLLSRSLFSPLLTMLTIALCIAWGTHSMRREGVRIRFHRPARAT